MNHESPFVRFGGCDCAAGLDECNCVAFVPPVPCVPFIVQPPMAMADLGLISVGIVAAAYLVVTIAGVVT
jgi:hypothetical protein